jgi:hypothetical protein
MKKRYIMAGKREGFDWEDEGRMWFTRDPEVDIASLAKDGYVEFFVLDQTMRRTAYNTEHTPTQTEEDIRNELLQVRSSLESIIENATTGVHVGNLYTLLKRTRRFLGI